MSFRKTVQNQRGQGLVEYLVIVALVGVATISIVRVMGQTVSSRFTSITHALQGNPKRVEMETIEERHYKIRDLGNFFEGAGSRGK